MTAVHMRGMNVNGIHGYLIGRDIKEAGINREWICSTWYDVYKASHKMTIYIYINIVRSMLASPHLLDRF
jgi:hypothetical protein